MIPVSSDFISAVYGNEIRLKAKVVVGGHGVYGH